MAEERNIRIEDDQGNIYYPHAKAKTTFLSNGKDVEAELKELFQFANNGKKNWVDVIGSPLVNTDTFSTLKDKTQNLKNILASILTNKGQSASATDTLANLVGKVANISTGIKGASGTTALAFRQIDATHVYYDLIISNLTFKPTIVYAEVISNNMLLYRAFLSELIQPNYLDSLLYDATIGSYITGSGSMYHTKTDTGFSLTAFVQNTAINYSVRWIALQI